MEDELHKRDIESLEKNFSRLEKKVDEGFNLVHSKLDLINLYMTRKEIMMELDKKAELKDVVKLESNQSRIAWLVITGVVLAVMGLVFIK